MLSSPPRDPVWTESVAGGGIQHVADCFAQYMQRKNGDPHLLIEYADRLGNGAVFKRLGFLGERLVSDDALIRAARLRLTKGYAKLDPALDCSRLITRWRLRVPATWTWEVARMIGKPEIIRIAGQLSLTPHIVEKDYALGWLLAGIFANEKIAGCWVFKGGTLPQEMFL